MQMNEKNQKNSQNLNNDHQNALLIRYLLDPAIPCRGKMQRARYKPVDFKILNAIYQLNKNIINNRWENISCGKRLIAKAAGVSVKAVTEFICGDGLVFFDKTLRHKKTNIYRLEPWVVEIFRFFEKTGMMKGVTKDFEKWRENFLKRIKKWVLPLLEKGETFSSILVNNLSMKKRLKGVDPKVLKGASIKSNRDNKAFQGSRSISEWPPDPILSKFSEIQDTLENKFHIVGGDLVFAMRSFSQNDLKRGIDTMEIWKKRGMEPRSPIKVFMSAISDSRKHRQNVRL